MRRLLTIGIVIGGLAALAAAASAREVLDVARQYDNGGGYHWTAGNSGTPIELRFENRVLLPRGKGSFCCGYTLAIAFEVAEERGLLAGKTFDEIRAFQKDWYGDGPDSRETLIVKAVERLGIGRQVAHPDAMPGDFVQLWRTSGSGHSVVLLDWVREDGKIVGLKYRSSQKSTDGIGDRVEYFSDSPGHDGKVVRDRTYLCRLFKNALEPSMQEAQQLALAGEYSRAEEILAAAAADSSAADATAAAIELERIRRARHEFGLNGDELLAQIQKQIPDATLADMARWRDAGDLQHRTIDGQISYFRRAASNLFRFNADAKRRSNPQAAAGRFDQTGLIAELVDLAEASAAPAVYPVRHKVKYTLTIKPGNPLAKPGAKVRVWLPYPQEYQQQQQVKLLSSSPGHQKIAANGHPHRTIYFEQVVQDEAAPLAFSAEYEYVVSAWAPMPSADEVQSYDKAGELYREFTAERLPHIALDDATRDLAAKIVGDEPNPLLRAKKIFRWVSANIPWCAEIEYCLIDSLAKKGIAAGRGDCGVQGMVFITLCRAAGVPARWQSGWQTKPGEENMHDWAEFYVEPWGWLPADASHGVRRHDDPRVQDFLCGGLDPYRMIVNLDFARELDPPKSSYRSEPNDFQRGEVEIDGHNLYFDQWKWDFEVTADPRE
ncbi:Transglutaminase-like superfamily protein [Posidoniimonas polymericola]|uniref:Transglutaminase-like superfamily protein n=1 Tax=Posidoniimonas polymericola TaxID=2528002 RepID=A0A5C5YQT8_9BACT|nr:transglutaminase-like domain-containing protein [Posidoniimonas polymericola]TWT77117.1 Transglutaminase-like superfamily protein [Posidoniimonas polymericola]